jgi:KUP system potassium uptake protein
MAMWREMLFVLMMRNAAPATRYFNLPTPRVLELGMQVDL